MSMILVIILMGKLNLPSLKPSRVSILASNILLMIITIMSMILVIILMGKLNLPSLKPSSLRVGILAFNSLMVIKIIIMGMILVIIMNMSMIIDTITMCKLNLPSFKPSRVSILASNSLASRTISKLLTRKGAALEDAELAVRKHYPKH